MEQWRPVHRYPGLYASDECNLRHDRNVFGIWVNADGYSLLTIHRRLEFVHRLIAEAWLDVRHGQLVLHINDVKDDNRVANLKLGTHRENRLDSVRNGSHGGPSGRGAYGHPFDAANTFWEVDAGAGACQRRIQANRARNARRAA